MISIRATSVPKIPKQTAALVVANPFGACAVAYVAGPNKDYQGTKWIIPMGTVRIIKRRPRTKFIDMSQMYCDATNGF